MPIQKYYVEMDAFESELREVASPDGDYYRVEDVQRLLDAARTWRSFQEEDSVRDQQTDMELRSEANRAAGRLLAAIDAFD